MVVYEIGYFFGLVYFDDYKVLMVLFYKGYFWDFCLDIDDIEVI